MKVETIGEQEIQVQIPLAIAKVDKTKREVEGIATQEIKDVHGEVVDHESMKAALADWPGNIREMHQPKAVGKAVKVLADDENKATILRARVSKGAPDTWEKVLDETLCMFSIGGTGKRVTQKNAAGETEKRVYVTALHEVSLVDNGACPTATFQIVKSVDGVSEQTEIAAAADECDDGSEVAADAPTAKSLDELRARFPASIRATELLEKFTTQIEAQLQAGTVEKGTYPAVYNIEQTLGAISCLERLLAEEWWKAHSADGTDTDRAQLVVLRNAIELVLAYLASEFAAQFEAEDPAVAMARRAGLVDDVEKTAPIQWHRLDGAGQLWIAKAGARHSKADVQMIQNMHDTAISLGALCAEKTAKAAAQPPADPPAAPVTEPAQKAAAPGQAAAPAAPEAAAAGQEGAQAPTAQKGADAPAQDPASTPVAQAAAAVDVQAIVKAAVAEALQAQKATTDSQIAELQAQVEKLRNEPAPGGPKTRATGTEGGTPVHKTLGNGAVTEALPDGETLAKFAEQLSRDAKSEDEKLRIATNLLRFQHATGVGAVAIAQTTGRPQPIPAEPAGQ